jgi:Mycothiol maleylpyruvate isomerase N-terminal domain
MVMTPDLLLGRSGNTAMSGWLWRTDHQQFRTRMIGCLADPAHEPFDVERTVPACPDWTARDLFSHMVGLGSDVVAGDEPDDHNEDWTAKQVRERADRSVTELVDEWRGIAESLRAWMTEHGTARSAT